MRRCGSILLLLALWTALLSPTASGADRFSDVPPGSWYADTAAAMADRGLLGGCPDGACRPGQTVSAAEFASAAGLPLFVSAWGTGAGGGVLLDASEERLRFLEDRGIRWANWSLCDRGETSAALRPGAPPSGGWRWEDLSESGRLVFARFRGR